MVDSSDSHKPVPVKMTTIEIINESTVVKDADAAAWTKALQIQVSRDFYPLWGANAILQFVPHGLRPMYL